MKKHLDTNNNLRTKNFLISLGVLILGLVITFVIAYFSNQNIRKHIVQELEIEATDLKGKIKSRLDAHIQFSRSAASYSMGVDTITKEDWSNFVNKSKISESLNGFQAIAQIISLPKDHLKNHLLHFKKNLNANYKVSPIGTDSIYTPIVFIEPFKRNNLKALGYNVSSNPLMKKAIEEARDLNKSVLTDKVILVQEGQNTNQPGIVIYSPVYKKGFPINTVEERRVAIKSWVGSSFRINDLMKGILNGNEEQETISKHLQIFDGDQVSEEAILFDNEIIKNTDNSDSSLNSLVLPIDLNGKKWTLKFESPLEKVTYGRMYFVVVICGFVISVLLGFLIFSLLNTSSFAKILAGKLTLQLVEKNKENKKLSSAVEQSSNIIVITDTESKIEYTNPKFSEISGYSQTEVLGKDPKILSNLNYDYVVDDISANVLSGKEWRGQFQNRTKQGDIFWVQTTIKPLINDAGEFTNLLMVSEDITQSKIIEEQLIQAHKNIELKNKELLKAKDAAEESSRLKSAFLANMSHEIRTPMNGILGFSGLLKQSELTGDKKNQYIEIIEKSGARMLNIINDIINISKIESDQMEVVISEVNINDQLEEIYSFFKPEANEKGLSLSVKYLSDEVIIETDSHKIYGILANFVKNAIKYSEKGSIELGVNRKEEKIEFFVKDSGIGIPMNRQKAIFDRFVQADISDARALQGAGLGLAISKAYAKMIGGNIWVVSEEGVGSTFFLEIEYTSSDSISHSLKNEN